MNHRLSAPTALLLLTLLAAGLFGLSLTAGSFRLSPAEILDALSSSTPSLARDVVLELRLPRALSAMAVGGLLALSGALLQVPHLERMLLEAASAIREVVDLKAEIERLRERRRGRVDAHHGAGLEENLGPVQRRRKVAHERSGNDL